MNEHLRCHILRCSDETKCFSLILHHLLASPHIDQLQIAIPTHHNIFRLEVTIDNTFMMKSFKHVDQQSHIEARLLKREDTYRSNHVEKIFAFDVFSQEINVVVVFE
jgi:hypothetical protein